MQWYNEAPEWQASGDVITMTVGPKTDFWRITHDNGDRDSGNFYYEDVSGDFVAEVRVAGDYQSQYDQAGLMLRIDNQNWIKCGIELLNGIAQSSVVVTREFSDWSVIPLSAISDIWLRVVRHGHTVEVHYSLDGVNFTMQRQAFFPTQAAVQVGVMGASPLGEGFVARFEGFRITKA